MFSRGMSLRMEKSRGVRDETFKVGAEVRMDVDVELAFASARALPLDFVLACEQLHRPRTFPMRHFWGCFQMRSDFCRIDLKLAIASAVGVLYDSALLLALDLLAGALREVKRGANLASPIHSKLQAREHPLEKKCGAPYKVGVPTYPLRRNIIYLTRSRRWGKRVAWLK